MRIRKVDANGDMVFGRGLNSFHVDVPDAPALACIYRLSMERGDWWLDTSAGTPMQTQVIGMGTASTRDPILRARILGTRGITIIADYSSNLDRETRDFRVNANVNTLYSTSPIALNATVSAGG